MAFEHYVRSGAKKLRMGYTTGTCAALAAAGAARLLLTGQIPETISLLTPKGLTVEVEPECAELKISEGPGGAETAVCGVVKDAGDDADVTHGTLVLAAVTRIPEPGVLIDGGEGVGRVTKPGLDQPVGAAAINHVPREMIRREVEEVMDNAGYDGGLSVIISLPDGQRLAEKTFNPMLGIEGGISILGTSGIVEPMSEQAIVDTIGVEMSQARSMGDGRIILTPGNYGWDFLAGGGIEVPWVPTVKCSNFLGDALDIAAVDKFTEVLFVSHIGKLVKVAGGIMNTHSRYADCRMELFAAAVLRVGGSAELARRMLEEATTDGALDVLKEEGMLEPVMEEILRQVQAHLERRAAGAFAIGAVTFSNVHGILGITPRGMQMIEDWNNKKDEE